MQIAPDNLAPQPTRELQIGDFLPDFQLVNQRGATTVLFNKVRGKHVVVLFYPDTHKPACQQLLRGFAERHRELDELAHLFAINNEGPEANAGWVGLNSFPFDFLLSDERREAARAYGIDHNLSQAADFTGAGAFTSLVADRNRRILQINRNVTDPGHAEQILALLRGQSSRSGREMGQVAPVLYIPRVLEPAFCRRLIEVFDAGGHVAAGTQRARADGSGEEVINPEVKLRRDYTVQDPALHAEIKQRIEGRVLPEIAKAFFYQVAGLESFRIVRYDADTGGYFKTHRDNTNLSTAHRRFAMTLNLNAGEYEGGQLRFPEYGPDLYGPAAGDAVIFSCSLLHEAMPVTAGQRYVLLAFLYGADGQRLMQARPPTKR